MEKANPYNSSSSWKHLLLSPGEERRVVLNHAFTGKGSQISMFFAFAGMLISAFYALHHLQESNYWIAGSSAVSFAALSRVFYLTIVKKNVGSSILIFLSCISLSLVLTSYSFGIRGLILNFPLIAAFFYSLRFSYALAMSVILVVSCLLSALNVHDPVFILRVLVATATAVVFFAAFAHRAEKQRKQLVYDANYDELTGIFNRRGFAQWLESRMNVVVKDNPGKLILFFIDLDDFKRINDTRGHLVGDQLLKAFAISLRDFMDNSLDIEKGAVARLAGDEFALSFVSHSGEFTINTIAQSLLQTMRKNIMLPSVNLTVSMSVGVASAERGGEARYLMRNADAALHWAKQKGKNRYQMFNQEIGDSLRYRAELEKSLQESLDLKSFYLVYMPIVDARTEQLQGVEVLVRSTHQTLVKSSPSEFIGIAESSGMMTNIDLWVICEAFQFSKEWSKQGLPAIQFSINISANELVSEYFMTELARAIVYSGIDTRYFVLEITETAFIHQEDMAIESLIKLREMGFKIALDDFGTGYMGFNQLAKYPVDHIKIDRSFISSLRDGADGMVDILLQICNQHGLNAVAEGVETPEQANILKQKGCKYLQGYLIGKPVEKDKLFETYLAEGSNIQAFENSQAKLL